MIDFNNEKSELEKQKQILKKLIGAYESQCFSDYDLRVQQDAQANIIRLKFLLDMLQAGYVLSYKQNTDKKLFIHPPAFKKSHLKRKLNVFLCHSSYDKPKVRDLYKRLQKEKDIKPWLDEEDLLPGSNWELEISRAIKIADVVIVCLSENSINKEGYIQKEIKQVLDIADRKPEGIIYIIPLKLEACIVPERLSQWQWLNYFDNYGYERLLRPLRQRAIELGLIYDEKAL